MKRDPIKWTPRNVVNVVLLLVCSVTLAVLSLGVVHAPWVSQAQTLAGGLLAGLLSPGSPVGRILDSVFPGAAETPSGSAPVDAQTVEDAKELLTNNRAGYRDVGAIEVDRPQPVKRSGREGMAHPSALWFVMLSALAYLVAHLHGCGASQLQTQAASTVVAMHAVRVAGDAVHADEQRARDACADDACLVANRRAHQPAEVAIDALRTAVLAWMDSIAVALAAEDETAQAAIAVAWQAVMARASDVVREIIDAGGVIPPELAALISGAS